MSEEDPRDSPPVPAPVAPARALLGRGLVLALGVTLAAVALLLGTWANRRSSAVPANVLLREFRFPSIDGSPIGPPDLLGRVVVVDFWATWCGPCHVQARILDGLVRELRGLEVEFLGVSVGEPEETVRAFFADRQRPYPIVFDEDARLSSEAGIYALPTVMVLDRRGEIVLLQKGLTGAGTLREAIEAALRES